MSRMMVKIWTELILRGNLIKCNNNITNQIKNYLKLEELLTERTQLETHNYKLSKQVRGLEVMVTDLTRSIRRMKSKKDMDVNLEKKLEENKASAEKTIVSTTSSTSAASDKKKIRQCR